MTAATRLLDLPDMAIPMPDGVRLSARVWMPADAATRPVPAVLEYIPYRKRDGTLPRDELMHPYVAARGYACVRVDMRGNGDSAGLMEDEYTQQEMDDAQAVIAWLAAQPWCSGAVGMMGKSWGGFNCLQAAFNQPPALRAVISVCSTTDRFADDIHFKGGCLLGENFGWGAVMLSYSSRPADPALRPDWREDWLARLDANPWLAPRWAAHQARDAYWEHGSICQDYSRMQTPVMIWGGWADNYMNTVGHVLANVPAPARGVMGPWVHQYPHTAVPGPQVGFLDMAVRWWDRWLKDIPNGAETDPALRAYILHAAPPDASARFRPGHWVAEPAWPSPRVSPQTLHLTTGALAAAPAPPSAPPSAPLSAPLSAAICTPQHLGLRAGEFFPMGLTAEMPGDQRPDDALSVCFDGAALTAPLTLLGQAQLDLTLSSDKPRAFIVARLCDVAPNGASTRIAHGMLNLCHAASMAHPTRLTPGQPVDVTVMLDMAGYRLPPGHHLRLALSTTYWPFVWPSPEPATLTVTSGALHLPVHDSIDTADEWTPPPAAHAAPWAHRVIRAPSASRTITEDMVTGQITLTVTSDEGAHENLSHGLIHDESLTEIWDIDPADPLCARATHVWDQTRSRGPWRTRTEARALMTSTATHLRLQASLRAWDGDELVFERHWDDLVSRDVV